LQVNELGAAVVVATPHIEPLPIVNFSWSIMFVSRIVLPLVDMRPYRIHGS
jgi:hypothetical protein